MSGLIFQAVQNRVIPLIINLSVEGLPLRDQLCRLLGAFVVRVVDMLNQCLARMQNMGVGHMVHEEQ